MEKLQIYFFSFLFLAVLFLSFQIILPFLVPLSIAATLAVLFHPLHERISRLLGDRTGLASFFTVILATLVIILPLTFVGTMVFREAFNFSVWLNSGGMNNIAGALVSLENQISNFFPNYPVNFSQYANSGLNWFAQNIGTIFAGVAQRTIGLIFDVFIGLMAFYYFLRDGRELIKAVVDLSPLPDKNDYEILSKLERAIISVVRGSLVIAVTQGVLASLGLTIFGIPNPALLGSIAAITALIPGVGVALIFIPSIAYLFIIGSATQALGLIVWWAVTIGLVDNMLSPMLIRRGIKVHPFLILISVIGGLIYFGPIGFLLGPVVLSLLFAMIEIYKFLVASEKKSFG
jgi:predicted PurR-regulated permease PerM